MTETKSIGKYDIVAELGRGGMGVVFKAWEDSLQRFVAIKMLGDQLTEDSTIVERFLREARAVADLNHPNVVQVFAVDTYEGRPYFAMEYVEGESLTELIHTARRVDPQRAAQLIKEAATGLAAAHAKDVIHRDIKPDNIMLTKHGGVKVVDFGIAKVEGADSKLTATGMMVGTPNYISPEVCLGQEVDARSDIFSLGIVFYEMLAGKTPFQADSPIAMMTAVVQAEVPDITTLNPEVDDKLRLILGQMLTKEREHRYQSCQQIVDDLEAYLRGQSPAHALAAINDATIPMQRPEVQAATVQTPVPPPSRTAQNKRVSQLSWVIGLMLIVGAAAGSWYYVAPATETSQASVDVESADTSAQLDQAVATTTLDDAERNAPEPESGRTITQAESLVTTGTAEPTPNIEPPEPTQPQPTQPAITSFATTQTVTTQPAVAQPKVVQPEAVKPAAPSGPPKFVVIARGDPAVSGVVESVLENALLAADFPVMDEQFFDGLNLNAFNPSLASIGRTVLDNGGSILVYADIRETGQRELKFYGRSERQTIANLQVQVVSLRDKRNVGAPWMAPMEYVPLNATDTAREVSEPIAQDLVARLQSLQ